MSIRLKIILIVIPLLATTLLLTGIVASLSADSWITKVAIDFLGFKAEELKKYADNQWSLLESNNLSTNEEFVGVSKKGVEAYAGSLIRSPTELIFALDEQGNLAMSTRSIEWAEGDLNRLQAMMADQKIGWNAFRAEGKDRVGQIFFFDPFGWYVLLTEARDTFNQGAREISYQNYVFLAASLVAGIILLLFFTSYLTKPISTMVRTMRKIIEDNDMSSRVAVEFRDEIGHMAQTFNTMLAELERAYNQVKGFALQSVLAQKNEQRIRNIFQKYVPASVLDEVLGHPESMLVGANRDVAILFSDIRSFTTISETMPPDVLVKSLNRYFSIMVDVIMNRNGTVDKYIGDAIMAIFGAPLKSENDALLSVMAGLEMAQALETFNREQVERGQTEFHIGIGINFGEVTVGNIGSEKKMNYTVIGDMVNLASRLEGLTKKYKQILLFSESVYQNVGQYIFCRMLDKVVVKGKTTGEAIYTGKLVLTEAEKKGWATHHSAMELYYGRDFSGAKKLFQEVFRYMPEDYIASQFIERCNECLTHPPGKDWDGTEVMHEK